MHFDDLSDYQYGRREGDPPMLNIGWLSRDHAFPIGDVPAEFVTALRALAVAPVNRFRGFHICELCPAPPEFLSPGGLRMVDPALGDAGNGEIRATASSGQIYAAPVMVLHYVEAHRYRPPYDFIAAVLAAQG